MFCQQRRSTSTSFSSLSRWPMLALAALIILLLTVSALLWTGTSPAGAQDGHQPDPQVVNDVWDYAKETQHGADHVLRWMRVLHTLGALDDMSAAEAQDHADQFWAARWNPVVSELTNLEAQDDYTPDTQVVDDVRGYAAETDNGFDHVLRWMRVLHTFDALDAMSAAEAQGYADQYTAARWDPVVSELTAIEEAAASSATIPSVSAVAVTSDAGDDNTYAPDDVVRIGVTFSEVVEVSGAPRLKIDMDPAQGGEEWASYASGSGTANLTFAHTVVEPNLSSQGVAVLANTLDLNGGAIQSAASNTDADLAHPGLNHDPAHKVDAAAPVPMWASVNGAELTVTFNEPLDEDSAPSGSAFTVTARLGGGPIRHVDGTGTANVDSAALTVTLAEAVLGGDTLTVAYAPPDNGPVRDLAGNAAAAFSGQAVANETPAVDPEAPRLSLIAATVKGRALTLAYDYHLHWLSVPKVSYFVVKVNGNEAAPVATRVSSSKVTLTLAEAVSADDTVTVNYTAEWWHPIHSISYKNLGYLYADNLTDEPVTNITEDDTAPTLSEPVVNGVELTLTFDEQLDPDAEPKAAAFSVQVNGKQAPLRAYSLTTNGIPKPPLEDPVPSIIGPSIMLYLYSAVGVSDAVTVQYDPPTTGRKLQDLAGNAVAAFAATEVENRTHYKPDEQLIADVESYARETKHGYDHVLRWVRVLKTLGLLEDMTAAEAQDYADRHQAARWDPVVAEFTNLEAQDDYQPNQQVITDVRSYAQETQIGPDHVLRWMRALDALGALADMTAAEALIYANQYQADRWGSVYIKLTELEAATAANEAPTRKRRRSVLNRPPVAYTNAEYYSWFTGDNNAPRGVLVSKPFYEVFSDPDGDELTYSVAISGGDSQLVDDLQITTEAGRDPNRDWPPYGTYYRVWFQADGDDDWKAITPTLPDRPVVTVTLTATDPDGLSASVSGDFLIWWESYPEVVRARADGAAIELTFDWAVEANPAPAPGQFTVHVVNEDGTAGTVEVNSVSVNGKVVTLELASALGESQTVTLDYAYNYPDDTPLQRAGGGDAAPGFRGQAVEFLQPPGEPQNLAVTATPGSLDISATWDALEGADTYKLRWRQSGGQFAAANAATVTAANATITVSDYGEWEVRLQACNDAGCGPEAVLQFTVEPPRSASQGYRGQLAEVLVELSLRRPAPAGSQTSRGVRGADGPTIQSSHTTSIVYVIDDSGSMDGDFPEVQTALEAVRDETMADTQVALIAFGSRAAKKFGLTDHSSAPWNTHINTFIGQLGGTKYAAPLQMAKELLDADTTATTKKIIFLSDAQEPIPSVIQAIKDAGIIVETIAFGDHYSYNFSVIEQMASDPENGGYRAVPKPSQGTTNTPAVAATAMSDILTGKVADNTATLFLVDHSFSVYRGNDAVLHPALTAAATKAGEGTGRQVGLAIFLGETPLFENPPEGYTADRFQKYQVINTIGSTSLSMYDGVFSRIGSTNIDHALQQAYSTITDSSVTATNKRVVLITDGISAVDVQTSTLNSYMNDSATTLDVVAWGQHADRVKLKGWADSAGDTFSVAKAGPPMPTEFTHTPGENAVTLSWKDPSDSAITKYQYRELWTSRWSDWVDLPGSGASTTWYIFYVAVNDDWYYVQLRAVRDDTPGLPSALLDVRATSHNIGLTATAGNGEIALSWNDPGDSTITKYQYIQRSGDGAWSAWMDISGSGATTTSHTVTGLTNGTEYTIAVRAVKGTDGFGPVSAAMATPSN